MFWWSTHYNSNIYVKGFLALLVGVVLTRLGKAHLLKWLVIGMILCYRMDCDTWDILFLGYTGKAG